MKSESQTFDRGRFSRRRRRSSIDIPRSVLMAKRGRPKKVQMGSVLEVGDCSHGDEAVKAKSWVDREDLAGMRYHCAAQKVVSFGPKDHPPNPLT
ncbi:hypothetical protein Dimus_001379, partial [Dionaea muscipula]